VSCKCKCCIKKVNEQIIIARQLLKAIEGLEKIEKTPQFGIAYSIAKVTLKDMKEMQRGKYETLP